MRFRVIPLAFGPALALACAHLHPARGLVPAGTPASVDIARARAHGGTGTVAWAPWSAETFARARREGRYVLFDGAAEWCHWCHVMDETTYRDPAVLRRLAERFIAVRVDIDARPDLAARYAPWGWPATVVFSPDGHEIARYRGYQPVDTMLALLAPSALSPTSAESTGDGGAAETPGENPLAETVPAPLTAEALGTLGPWIARAMDDVYDPAEGSWGNWQKVALGANVLFELRRAAHGDVVAGERARFTLRRQRALIDPVWGGVCQYSAGSTWDDPHFEKLMTYQAATIEAAAAGWAATHDPDDLSDARRVEGFLAGFLTAPSGAFLPSQDADVNAHDREATFVDGHVYQRLDDPHRRALGLPRVDPNVYARENGLAIAALASLQSVAPDGRTLARAVRAADVCLEALVTPEGAVRRTPGADARAARYLADAAALGRAFVLLARALPATGSARGRDGYLSAARSIARGLHRDFGDDRGGLWDRAGEPDGPLPRGHSVEASVAAARFLAALSTVTGEAAWREDARRILAATATPAAVDSLGRMLGELLLALDETGLYPWNDTPWPGGDRRGEHHVLTVAPGQGVLDVTVRPTDGQHINQGYPVSLTLEARGAVVPGVMHRAEAVAVTDAGLTFRARVTTAPRTAPATVPGTVIRGTVRFALCGAETCVPQERWFTVTTP